MTNEDESPIAVTTRNVMILAWLREIVAKDALRARRVARDYADDMGCPLCEVEHALDMLTDATSLDWLWVRYEGDIRAADFLRRD